MEHFMFIGHEFLSIHWLIGGIVHDDGYTLRMVNGTTFMHTFHEEGALSAYVWLKRNSVVFNRATDQQYAALLYAMDNKQDSYAAGDSVVLFSHNEVEVVRIIGEETAEVAVMEPSLFIVQKVNGDEITISHYDIVGLAPLPDDLTKTEEGS